MWERDYAFQIVLGDVISVSDTLRRKLIASVHVGDRLHVGAGK